MREQILESGAPVLDVGLRRTIPRHEVKCLSIGGRRITIGKSSRKSGNTDLSRRWQRSRSKVGQIDDRILREASSGSTPGERYAAVEAKEIQAAKVVFDGCAIRYAVAAAEHEILLDLVSKADTRAQLFEIPVLEGVAVNAGWTMAQENQRSGNIVGAGIRSGRIESGFPVQHFFLGKRNLPAEAKVEGQLRCNLKIVLNEKVEQASAIARLGGENGAIAFVNCAKDKTGDRMPRVRCETWKRGFTVAEREITRKRTGFKSVVTIAADLSTKLQAVLALQVRKSILVHVTL